MLDPLHSRDEIRRTIERGLLNGLWSVNDIAKGSLNPVLPSLEFLEAHPRFKDRHYRDFDAYRRQRNQPTTTTDDEA
jgi:hypothetical protein